MVNEENCEEKSLEEDPSIHTSCEEHSQFHMGKGHPKGSGKGPKGKGKGKKGKPGKGGFRNQPHRDTAPQLNFDGSKGKGKGKPYPKDKGKKFPIRQQRKNTATEEKENPAPLQRVNLVYPHTHPSHVGFATGLGLATPRTAVGDA